jgi:hypothetical protein
MYSKLGRRLAVLAGTTSLALGGIGLGAPTTAHAATATCGSADYGYNGQLYVHWSVVSSSAPNGANYHATFTLNGFTYASTVRVTNQPGTIPGQTPLWNIARGIASPARGIWHISGVTGCSAPDLGVSVK